MTPSEANFRHNVKLVLAKKNISLQWLAEQVGCARPNLSRFFNGKEGLTFARAEKIAKAIDVPLHVLIWGKIAVAEKEMEEAAP